ncbi:hypothetical protein GCM10009867_24080 [Pedococcus aerophilus]|uniref:Uncharacterized protein n=1 Tax=Pedococcus aerophilus TaxID=436356 RepID=A0ABN3UQN1_9MICO
MAGPSRRLPRDGRLHGSAAARLALPDCCGSQAHVAGGEWGLGRTLAEGLASFRLALREGEAEAKRNPRPW